MVKEAQRVLFEAIGEVVGNWEGPKGGFEKEIQRMGRKGDLGEGGMYI
jgi:hypothetical protein